MFWLKRSTVEKRYQLYLS